MKTSILVVALATVIAGCAGTDFTSPNIPITKPIDTTPTVRAPDPVTFDNYHFRVLTGASRDLQVHATNPSGVPLEWTSTNPSVATVINGVITGKGFGVDTIKVTPQGGTATAVQIFVADRTLSFGASALGCPTAAETLFVSAAIPSMNFSGDTPAISCTATAGTIAMSRAKARTIRLVVADAGSEFGTLLYAPNSTSHFEWMISEARMLGISFRHLAGNASGACCESGWTQALGGVIIIDPADIGTVNSEAYDESRALAYLALLTHEIRHIIYGAHTCNGSVNVNDQNVAQQGPYGAEYELRMAASKNPAFSSATQSAAATVATNMLTNNFCDKPSLNVLQLQLPFER